MKNIIFITTDLTKDLPAKLWFKDEKDSNGNLMYNIIDIVYDGDVEKTISSIKLLGEDILDNSIIVRGFIKGVDFCRIVLAFAKSNTRVYHKYIFDRHRYGFSLIDSVFIHNIADIPDIIRQEQDNNVSFIKTKIFDSTCEGDGTTIVSKTFCEALYEKAKNKVLIFSNLEIANFVARYFLQRKGWVARGFIKGLVFPCIFMACDCNPKSIYYAIKQIEKEERINNEKD